MANYNNNNNEELLGNDEEIREKARIKIFPMEPLIFFWRGCRAIECIIILQFLKVLLSINEAYNKLINNWQNDHLQDCMDTSPDQRPLFMQGLSVVWCEFSHVQHFHQKFESNHKIIIQNFFQNFYEFRQIAYKNNCVIMKIY